jgi:hypothetical protein
LAPKRLKPIVEAAIGRAESETLRDALRLLVSDDFAATFEHTLSE